MRSIKKIVLAGMRVIFDRNYRFLIKAGRGVYDNWSDEDFLLAKYKAVFKKELDLDDPKTFNEKLQWLKLRNRLDEYTIMADKYLVRDYISEMIGEHYLIPLVGVWDSVDDIDFDSLPEKFVLKCNHNSGLGMCICKDKSKLNVERVKKELRKGLKEDYYLHNREWPYKNIKRKIIAEKYMEDSSGGLCDYKVLCFNGEPKLIEFHKGRFTNNQTQDFYDCDWNKTSISQSGGFAASSIEIPKKPEVLPEMINLSRILSKDIPHVRVDWYLVDGQLYFGELTFFDGAGFDKFDSYDDDLLLGSWIEL